jgi:hypothetical protein
MFKCCDEPSHDPSPISCELCGTTIYPKMTHDGHGHYTRGLADCIDCPERPSNKDPFE